MSILFTLIQNFYTAGLYSNNDIAYFVNCNNITADDYRKITGQELAPTNNK